MTRILLSAMALLFLAAFAQAKLEIQNVQAVYGPVGPERDSLDVYPADEIFFRFTVGGVKADAEGRAEVNIAMKLTNADGDLLLAQENPLRVPLSLGGDSFPSNTRIALGDQTAPGEYTLTVTVVDKLSQEKVSFQRKIVCKPVTFALVAAEFFYDMDGKMPAPAGGVVGQVIHFRSRVIGFDKSNDKIDTTMTAEIIDPQGKNVLPKPIVGEIKQDDPDVVRKVNFVTFRSQLLLNRPGNFTFRIKVVDNNSQKTAAFEAPIRVTTP
jgi:hypothetical protein